MIVEACTKPPTGWRCTRADGHNGPCAALPAPVRADEDACAIGEAWLTRDPAEVPMGGAIGRVMGAAREAYAAGRAAAFKDAEEWIREAEGDGVASDFAIAARATEETSRG